MGLFNRKPIVESVTVMVDDTDVSDALSQIQTAKEQALREIIKEARKIESATAEAKAERGRLEAAVATARRRGQGRW